MAKPAGTVLLERRVTADPLIRAFHPHLVAEPGIHPATANPHGAVCVVTPGGELGLKPGEFEWVTIEPWLEELGVWNMDGTIRRNLPEVGSREAPHED